MDTLAVEVDRIAIAALEKTNPQLVADVRTLKANGVTKKEILAHFRKLGLKREEHLTLLAIEAVMEQE